MDGEEEVQLYIRRVNSEMVLNFFNNLEGENIFSFVFLFVDIVEIYTKNAICQMDLILVSSLAQLFSGQTWWLTLVIFRRLQSCEML